ncbi:MAG: rRNA (uracil1939-C5)-methyltransferase [Blastocatellia bacterium]|jgi:23S rRNA (uracil1939-C5)-methyltransferase|nr:rRNA (uracil1939-C5)-methyltransferase [Blastocatellia bacterium]
MKKRKRARADSNRRDERSHARKAEAVAEVELLIERVLPGGLGLAHDGGRTFLVSLAAPGDKVRVVVERASGSVSFASITEIIEPSPARITPPCPYFGRCGGCDFQQLNYAAQLEAKQEIISDCLRRLARVNLPAREIPINGSPLEWQYRSRAQWQHDARRQQFGYFERASHRVCDVAACPVLAPALQETFATLRQQMREGTLPANVNEYQAVAGDDGAVLAPALESQATARDVSRTIGEHRYHFNAEGFFQINHEMLPSLVAAATDGAEGASAVDLYCGVGLFTLPLARRFARVTGVEANPSAIAYAGRNLSDAQLANATFECARVGEYLADHAAAIAPADFVLLDPPRAGAEPQALAGILALRPEQITYVSCDPATLARDLKELLSGGYQLESVAAFDMFPQTHHVETVAKLKRDSRP